MNSPRRSADTSDAPRQGQRLPPGQVLTDKWPVLHHGSVPKVDLATWSFRVFGLVERETRWTWEQFLALPRVEVRTDIHCVTRWSRFDNLWQGVAVTEVLRRAGVKPEARHAIAHAEHGFTANLPLAELLRDDVLL
ncbi:MAG TPA: molybdopterin-dependent oxidoreductase, partial [Candidatus Eisenbacteria bacterium]